jgi:LPXTG-motif cell wall-anchored protein
MDTGTLIRVIAGVLFVIVLYIIIRRRRNKATQ